MSHSTQVFVKPWFKWADSFSRPQVNGELVPQFWSLWNEHVLQEKMPNILCLEPLKYIRTDWLLFSAYTTWRLGSRKLWKRKVTLVSAQIMANSPSRKKITACVFVIKIWLLSASKKLGLVWPSWLTMCPCVEAGWEHRRKLRCCLQYLARERWHVARVDPDLSSPGKGVGY